MIKKDDKETNQLDDFLVCGKEDVVPRTNKTSLKS